MASAARGESSNPYGGGLGIGGKVRKSTTREPKKPYDRLGTSARNSGLGGGEDRGGGWLSKLVDPAQRLITYSAHRLFASVFRKRLVSGETLLQSPEQQKQLLERDVNQETKVGQKEDNSNVKLSMKNHLIRMEDTNASVHRAKDGFTDLEKILKDKTFTRSEVDRLTTLLRSKAADSSTVNEEQRNEASVVVRHPPSHERDRTHPDNGSMNALVSAPLGSSRMDDTLILCSDMESDLSSYGFSMDMLDGTINFIMLALTSTLIEVLFVLSIRPLLHVTAAGNITFLWDFLS